MKSRLQMLYVCDDEDAEGWDNADEDDDDDDVYRLLLQAYDILIRNYECKPNKIS